MKRLALGILSLALLASLVPAALAETGDQTFSLSSGGAELGTDKCPGADLAMAITGAPGTPDDYDLYIGSGYHSCTTKVRMVAIAGDGHSVVRTGWVYGRKGAEAVLPLDGVYRCWVAFGVRRRDRTWYIRRSYPEKQEVDTCPK
jgi:hypothetical protein